MSRSLNKVILIGNATRDAELRHTQHGKPVAGIRLATNRMVQTASINWSHSCGEASTTRGLSSSWVLLLELVPRPTTRCIKFLIRTFGT